MLTRMIKPVANHVKPVPKPGTFIKVPLNAQTIQFLQNMNTIPKNMRNHFVLGNHGSIHGRGFYSVKNYLPRNINTNYDKVILIPNNKKNNVIYPAASNLPVNNLNNFRRNNLPTNNLRRNNQILIIPNNKKAVVV